MGAERSSLLKFNDTVSSKKPVEEEISAVNANAADRNLIAEAEAGY